MSKQITNIELAEIITNLLTDPDTINNNLDTREKFADFMRGAAMAVCDACGGEVSDMPPGQPIMAEFLSDEMGGQWLIGIHWNDSLPDDGGIWANYDTEVDWGPAGEDATPANMKG